MLAAERLHRQGVRVPQPVGPRRPVRAVHLRDGRPGREVRHGVALAQVVGAEGAPAAHGPLDRVDQAQRLALGGPGGVTVDPLGVGADGLGTEGIDPGPVGRRQVGVLRDPLGTDVERVHVAPGRREVRRGLHRRGRLGGVQRVDEHVRGAVVDGDGGAEVLEVDEVTDPPAAGGPGAVELRGQAPVRAPAQTSRHADALGGDHERHPGPPVARPCVHPVVAQRQVAGHREGRLPDGLAVDHAGRVPVVALVDATAVLAGLQLHPDVDSRAVGHVHHEGAAPPFAGDQHGRQQPSPGRVARRRQGRPRRFRAARVDVERRQHGDHRVRGDQDVAALPVPVVDGDAVRRRQLADGEVVTRVVTGVLLRHAVTLVSEPGRVVTVQTRLRCPRGRRRRGARTSRLA